MIKMLESGTHNLLETRKKTRVLILENGKTRAFAWLRIKNGMEILSKVSLPKDVKTTLCVGTFRLYGVKDEKDLTDLTHLELHTGRGKWQGYLLPTGLPNNKDPKNRIIPTDETITRSFG